VRSNLISTRFMRIKVANWTDDDYISTPVVSSAAYPCQEPDRRVSAVNAQVIQSGAVVFDDQDHRRVATGGEVGRR
jgi:hypothetical protein